MFKTPPIIVLLTIGDEQKAISLIQKFEFSGIYDIILDKEYQGQVQRAGKGWTVNTVEGSCIQRDHYVQLTQAVENAIRPNS